MKLSERIRAAKAWIKDDAILTLLEKWAAEVETFERDRAAARAALRAKKVRAGRRTK